MQIRSDRPGKNPTISMCELYENSEQLSPEAREKTLQWLAQPLKVGEYNRIQCKEYKKHAIIFLYQGNNFQYMKIHFLVSSYNLNEQCLIDEPCISISSVRKLKDSHLMYCQSLTHARVYILQIKLHIQLRYQKQAVGNGLDASRMLIMWHTEYNTHIFTPD